jgi:hypothetical protein
MRRPTRAAEGDKFPPVAPIARAISRKDRRVTFVIPLLGIFDEVIIDWFSPAMQVAAVISIARYKIGSALSMAV